MKIKTALQLIQSTHPDIISIRKYGKYKFDSLVGNTKKDKLRIVIKKFI